MKLFYKVSPCNTNTTTVNDSPSIVSMLELNSQDLPNMESPIKDANGDIFTCTNGVDENNELPADGLPSAECAAINHGTKIETKNDNHEDVNNEDNNNKDIKEKDISQNDSLRFQQNKKTNQNKDQDKKDDEQNKPLQRKSWCIEADKVDGLQVKIYNYGAASLAKKAIQWWKKGYTFPNTPWYDDLQSVAVILCGYMAQHVSEFDVEGRKLCTRMRQGYYRENPLHALTHPYFSKLLEKDEIVMAQRNNYIYKPQKDCSCKENQKVGKRQRKKTKPCTVPTAKTEDGVNEGQIILARMFGKGKDFKDGDPVPSLNQDVVASTRSLDPPSAHSPLTPWIVTQSIDPIKGTSVTMKWQKFKNASLYNFMLDGISVYTGSNTAVSRLKNVKL